MGLRGALRRPFRFSWPPSPRVLIRRALGPALLVVGAAAAASERPFPAPPGDTGASVEAVGRLLTRDERDGARGAILLVGRHEVEVDLRSRPELAQQASRWAGAVMRVSGIYAERRSDAGVRSVILADRMARSRSGSAPGVWVAARGTLRTGVMAIGAETTGVTLVAGAVTWELDIEAGGLAAAAARLAGRTVVVRGTLEFREGVEIRRRVIVRVRSIAPA